MQFNINSEEQAQTIKMIEDQKLSIIHYLDIFMLSSTLGNTALRKVAEGKRVIFIIEDSKILSLLDSKINSLGIGAFSIVLNESDFLADGDLSKIRYLYKWKEEKDGYHYQLKVKNQSLLVKRIESCFTSMGSKIFGDRKWLDICRIDRKSKRRITEIYQKIKLEFTPQEFWHLRGKIEEAQTLYNQKNILSDNILEKFRIVLDSPDSIERLKENLIDFKEKLSQVTLKLDAEINRYEEKIWDKLHEEFIVLKNIGNDLELALIKSKKPKADSKRSFFYTGKNSSDHEEINISHYFDILKNNILFTLDDQLAGLNNKEAIEKFVEKLHLSLEKWQTIGENIVLKMMKSLNKHNSDTTTLLKIDQELNMLFSELNESRIFADQFENTSMNILNQYGFLSDLLKSIKILIEYINNNRELILWQSFYHQLTPEAKAIVDLLKNHDSNLWVDMFESWYYEKLIHHKSTPDVYNLDILIEEYKDEIEGSQGELADFINFKFAESRQRMTNLFRNKNKKAYNDLFKKKGIDNLRYFDLVWEEKEMITHYIPVTIINSKLLKSNRLLKDGNWDVVFCDNTRIFDYVEKATLLEQKICFMTRLENSVSVANEFGINHDDPAKTTKLLLHEYNYKNQLKDLPLSEKLKAAKKLAKLLLSLNQNLKIYQLKFANIISLLSMDYNEMIESELDVHGLKESEIEGKIYEAVTESILETDRNQYLFIQDYLINLEHDKYFMWQLKVLDVFKQAGFRVFNLKSFDKKSKKSQIDPIIQSILPEEVVISEPVVNEE